MSNHFDQVRERTKVVVWSDPDHEEVTIEIYFDGEYFALISQDKGPENLEVEFSHRIGDEIVVRKLPYALVIGGLEQAREILLSSNPE